MSEYLNSCEELINLMFNYHKKFFSCKNIIILNKKGNDNIFTKFLKSNLIFNNYIEIEYTCIKDLILVLDEALKSYKSVLFIFNLYPVLEYSDDLFILLKEIELNHKIIYTNFYNEINAHNKRYNLLLLEICKNSYFVNESYIEQVVYDLKKYDEFLLHTSKEACLKIKNIYRRYVSFDFDDINVLQLPFGEVYIPLNPLDISGNIYINNHHFNVLNGKIKGAYTREVTICELGVGVNEFIPKISKLPYYEKKYGTIHLGFGDNVILNGENDETYHFDYVIENFKLYGVVNGKKELICAN